MRVGEFSILLIFLSFMLFPVLTSADSASRDHATEGLTIGISRGVSLRNDELEAVRTDEFTLGMELSPNVLQLRIPFKSYETDTRGELLPRGRVRAKSVGASLWLGFGGERWTPILGAGGSFNSFQEQFMSAGNLENAFGLELYGGLRFRLVENLWDYLRLRGIIHYQATLLKPGVQLPEHPEKSSISMHRHSIMLTLEVVGI